MRVFLTNKKTFVELALYTKVEMGARGKSISQIITPIKFEYRLLSSSCERPLLQELDILLNIVHVVYCSYRKDTSYVSA